MASESEHRSGTDQGLKRILGPVDATCIVIGAIIGVGIFSTPSQVAQVAGSGSMALTAWAIGGAIALMGALTFAELGGLYPRTGGQYEILRDAYSPLPAFLFVFCNATAIQAGAIAVIAIICAKHLGLAIGNEITGTFAMTLSAAGLIVGLTAANALGVRWGSRIQNLTVYAKVLTLIVVTILAIMTESPVTEVVATESTEQSDSGRAPIVLIFAALVPAFFAFGGWQSALWMAGEIRQPKRNVPLAIVGGVLVVVTIYLLVNWAYLRLLGYDGVVGSQTIAADAVAKAWPNIGRRVAGAAVAVSAFGVLNAQLLGGPRLIYSMANDGRFFRLFAHVNTRFKTPVAAIVLLGLMALVLLIVAGQHAVEKLTTGVVFIDSVFFALTGLALIVLRKRRPRAERPMRVPGYPVVPLLFVLGELCILAGALFYSEQRITVLIGVGWILGATLLYFLFFYGSRRQ
ncbi:MAG: amino acid permease [Planctomycetes bacterium]|nr:amino acid permease [Planctomycetota bacterium]MCH8259352.1 amino acid permease [Planctomycetota bacterium]